MSGIGKPDDATFAGLNAESAALKERLLRTSADLENLRRRGERDLADARQYAIADFAGDMLHVADNLRRALASAPAEEIERESALAGVIKGVELTEKEMLRALQKHGIEKLRPVGKRFDPNVHEAILQTFEPSLPDGTVTEVMEDGYSIGSRVLRPAKVVISSREPQAFPGPDGE